MNELRDFVIFDYSKWNDLVLRPLLQRFTVHEVAAEVTLWLDDPGPDFYEVTTFARDLYIGSDLLEHEREEYAQALVHRGFFNRLSAFLCHSDFHFCSWTIYTFGKFSRTENVGLLEAAYENHYSVSNPLLAYRCLSELSWLGSVHTDQYIEHLQTTKSLQNWLILAGIRFIARRTRC